MLSNFFNKSDSIRGFVAKLLTFKNRFGTIEGQAETPALDWAGQLRFFDSLRKEQN
jgi:hypothetical protein